MRHPKHTKLISRRNLYFFNTIRACSQTNDEQNKELSILYLKSLDDIFNQKNKNLEFAPVLFEFYLVKKHDKRIENSFNTTPYFQNIKV